LPDKFLRFERFDFNAQLFCSSVVFSLIGRFGD
jgi:hypothetical protein